MTFSRSLSSFVLIASLALGSTALAACGGDDDDDGDDTSSSGGASSSGGGSSGGSSGGSGSSGAGGSSGASSSSGGASSSSGGPAFTGTVTWKGSTAGCKVSTQLFDASDEYSVLCQTDGNEMGFGSVLVQVTFKNEASARTAGAFTPYEGHAFTPEDHADPTTVEVDLIDDAHAYATTEDSTGTITVAASAGHDVITLTSVQQFLNGVDDSGVVTATINF